MRISRLSFPVALLASGLALAARDAVAQQAPNPRPPAPAPRRGFNLFALPDLAASGMRNSSTTSRFIVSNSGPMDMQQNLAGTIPASALRSGTRFNQFVEVTLFASAAPGDWLRNRTIDTSLAAVTGGGAALSFNYHFANPGISNWTATDGSLGFRHSGARSTGDNTCLNHTASGLAAGVTLMAGSDCPQTWGANGWEGRRPIPQSSYLTVFSANKAAFRFNFFEVPTALQDTTSFLGDKYQTYGVADDYGRERRATFGRILPNGTGAPSVEGYPLGLEWKFDAFQLNTAPNVIFWQATITNRTRSLYGVPLDYDSLYVGLLARHARQNRGRVGFDIRRGTVVFNENGHNATCDNAKAVPGVFSFGGYTGNCPSVLGFNAGTSALVFLKSPIGDLRYKQFTDAASPFFFNTSPVRGDTLTYNIGHLCGDDCIQDRFSRAGTGFGVIASREALALGPDNPASLDPFQYWQLFHPANGAPYGTAPRVNLSVPRAGGGFNFMVPAGWRYSTRPSGATAAGNDTLFLDTCNPISNTCVGIWLDTLPDRSINFTRNATWVGAGPFRLAADSSTSLIVGIVAAGDSTTVETTINQAISLYQGFFVAPSAPPAPRVVSARVVGGSTRVTSIRILLDNRTIGWTDPFVQSLSDRYRTAAAGTVEARLNTFNPRLGPLSRTIADTLAILAKANTARILVYKSCDNGRNFTSSSSPNLCTRDFVTDSLGQQLGPAAYRSLSADSVQFIDGNVLAGQTYYYAFVPISRGVRLQLTDSTLATGRRTFDTLLVAPTSAFPTTAAAPNVAVVYVPASQQAGSAPSRVLFRQEIGPKTLARSTATNAVDTTWNGLVATPMDSLRDTVNYRLVFGDTVVVKEYATTGVVDSTVVIVRRNITVGYTYATGTGASPATIGRYAIPTKQRLDTLRFVSYTRTTMPIVGSTGTAVPDTVVGAKRIRTSILPGTIGSFVTSSTSATHLGPFGQAVLVRVNGATETPVLAGNDLGGSVRSLTTNAKVLGSPDYADVNVEVANRPLIINWTSTNNGGAQFIEKYYADAIAGRILSSQPNQPTISWQQTVSRLLGTNFGEFVIKWSGSDFGPNAPFSFYGGLAPLQADFTASVNARTEAQTTDTSAAVIAAINTALGLTGTAVLTQDSLVAIGVPFTISNTSNDRPVIVAMRKADLYTTYLLGTGADTGRVTVPAGHWVPGEPVVLLEQSRVAATSGGVVVRDASGQPVYKDTLTVLAYRAVLGCTATAPFTCNPLAGRGGTGYIPTNDRQDLVVRYAVPYTSEREFAFSVTPLVAGTRVTSVSRAQLDSIKVVPNPYILYSNYEQDPTNEQRVMFTHLPSSGIIRIYTASGHFVQQVTWTPEMLRNGGDLYFNLLTREGTQMASGLYLFTVTATDASGGGRTRTAPGRFIIIR